MEVKAEGHALKIHLLLGAEVGGVMLFLGRVLSLECPLLHPGLVLVAAGQRIVQIVILIAHILGLKAFLAP